MYEAVNTRVENIPSIINQLEEFNTDGNTGVVVYIDSKLVLKNIPSVSSFGPVITFGYKFENDQVFPMGSLLKVKCTTTDGKTFIVSPNVCSDGKFTDHFVLNEAISELKNIGLRDVEILIKINSEGEYISSQSYSYEVELKAILGVEKVSDPTSTYLELNQPVILEDIVGDLDNSSKNLNFKLGNVLVQSDYQAPLFDSKTEDYFSNLAPMRGDKIQIKGKVINADTKNPVVEISWLQSTKLLKAGEQRQKINSDLEKEYKNLLAEATDKKLSLNEKNRRFAKLIVWLYDKNQRRFKISDKQFKAFYTILKNQYRSLKIDEKPVIIEILEDYEDKKYISGYLMPFAQGIGSSIMFCSKLQFKHKFIEFYSNDELFSRIHETNAPLLLLKLIFSPNEIDGIIETVVLNLKNKSNLSPKENSMELRHLLGNLISGLEFWVSLEKAQAIFERLTDEILEGKYRKKSLIEKELILGPDNYFENSICNGLQNFLIKAIDESRSDLIVDFIRPNGKIEQIIKKLQSSDAYTFEGRNTGYYRNFEEMLDRVKNYHKKSFDKEKTN